MKLHKHTEKSMQLSNLYQKIHDCHVCQKMNPEKALRRQDAVDFRMDTLIISQALAETQLRRSGVNFFNLEGRLGNTGKKLEKFINLFGRTVYPPKDIHLSSGAVVPKCRYEHIPVYNTELTQCFPGKRKNRSDREPSVKEIQNCLSKGFIETEISIINPKLLLLMGDKSRRGFYKYFLNEPRKDTLGEHIFSIIKSENVPNIKINNQTIYILPIQHASGANPNFSNMLKEKKLVELIKEVLR